MNSYYVIFVVYVVFVVGVKFSRMFDEFFVDRVFNKMFNNNSNGFIYFVVNYMILNCMNFLFSYYVLVFWVRMVLICVMLWCIFFNWLVFLSWLVVCCMCRLNCLCSRLINFVFSFFMFLFFSLVVFIILLFEL